MDTSAIYTKGTEVWVRDNQEIWIGGRLTHDFKDNKFHIELDDGATTVIDYQKNNTELPPLRNQRNRIGAKNLTSLSHLHEPAVLYSLKERFVKSKCIYTYCGIVLVALNPYEDVPLYGPDIISKYNSGQNVGEMEPHLFAVAEKAYRNMATENMNQSIIVSGESGAGKTVSAKWALRYFANVSGNAEETTVEMEVMSSNPIMEAYYSSAANALEFFYELKIVLSE